jgi:hypothetical protein
MGVLSASDVSATGDAALAAAFLTIFLGIGLTGILQNPLLPGASTAACPERWRRHLLLLDAVTLVAATVLGGFGIALCLTAIRQRSVDEVELHILINLAALSFALTFGHAFLRKLVSGLWAPPVQPHLAPRPRAGSVGAVVAAFSVAYSLLWLLPLALLVSGTVATLVTVGASALVLAFVLRWASALERPMAGNQSRWQHKLERAGFTSVTLTVHVQHLPVPIDVLEARNGRCFIEPSTARHLADDVWSARESLRTRPHARVLDVSYGSAKWWSFRPELQIVRDRGSKPIVIKLERFREGGNRFLLMPIPEELVSAWRTPVPIESSPRRRPLMRSVARAFAVRM